MLPLVKPIRVWKTQELCLYSCHEPVDLAIVVYSILERNQKNAMSTQVYSVLSLA